MEIIYIGGVTQSIFLAFLVFGKKSKSTSDYILAFWLVLIAFNLLDYYFAETGFALKHPYLLSIGTCIPLLHGPFMLIYILLMINTEGKFKTVYLLHGLPFLIFTFYLVFNFYFLKHL